MKEDPKTLADDELNGRGVHPRGGRMMHVASLKFKGWGEKKPFEILCNVMPDFSQTNNRLTVK